ncbi:MAG: hypothetical protein R3B98_02425 [Hyphomonas sp.]
MRIALRTGLYLVLAVLWPVTILAGCLALVLANETRLLIQEFIAHDVPFTQTTYLFIGAIIFLVFLCVMLVWGLRQLIREPLKMLRNLSAAELIEIRDDGDARPFSLFLRPFRITNQIGYNPNPVPATLTELTFGTRRHELEEVLADGFWTYGELIGIGQPREHLGAGRIFATDETWQALIASLLPRARWVVLIPSTTMGTMWEIETLRAERHLAKTIVILPQTTLGDADGVTQGFLGAGQQAVDISAWRRDADAALEQAGYRVKSTTTDGLAIQFGPDGVERRAQPFRMEDMAAFWQFVDDLERERQGAAL